jgi:hypothetical protein
MKKILIIIKNLKNEMDQIFNKIVSVRAEKINKEGETYLKSQLKRYGNASKFITFGINILS